MIIHRHLPKNQIQEEFPINSLPVDILIDQTHILQVNGPSHFVIIDENLNHERSLKDHFHDTILNIDLSKKKAKSATAAQKNYIIINIDWRKFDEKKESYLFELLKDAGLKPKENRTSKIIWQFYKPISNAMIQSSSSDKQETPAIKRG